MTKTPKEQAIGKIAEIIDMDLADWGHDAESMAMKVIEALPVEWVDDESEVQEGDVIYKDGEAYVVTDIFVGFKGFEILKRNGKHVINVDDIKRKMEVKGG